MIEVNTVDLSEYGVEFPADRLGVVLSQPHLRLSAAEPFVTVPDARGEQLTAILRTLEVAKSCPHQLDRTHLTVLPEYSIPGLEGVAALLQALSEPSWPNATIVVGGIDGLTRADYEQLCDVPNVHYAEVNSPASVGDNEWVNCSITAVKCSDGEVHSWLQPKIWPAWEEQNIRNDRMFRGRAINLFKGKLSTQLYFRLTSVICFDWIATVDAKSPIDWVVSNLDDAAGEAQLPLTWALVIQNNPKPSHHTFLTRIPPFFDQQRYPRALRSNACLLFCNSAGKPYPAKSREYGASSVVHSRRDLFSSQHNAPTVSRGGPRYREGSDALNAFHDTYFRERGACIHAFTLINPSALAAGPQGRSFAVDDARVFAFGAACARAPNGPVAASVKWMNDFLDGASSISTDFEDAPLAGLAETARQNVADYLRRLNGRQVSRLVEVASGTTDDLGADDWGDPQEEAATHVSKTLDILASASVTQEIVHCDAHAALDIGGRRVEVLAMQGRRHEECLERARWASSQDQCSLLVVTRDDHNTPWDPTFGSFLEQAHDGGERFTFPSDNKRQIGFQNLLVAYRGAQDQQSLAEWLEGALQ